jgi:hypothetical protein
VEADVPAPPTAGLEDDSPTLAISAGADAMDSYGSVWNKKQRATTVSFGSLMSLGRDFASAVSTLELAEKEKFAGALVMLTSIAQGNDARSMTGQLNAVLIEHLSKFSSQRQDIFVT